MRRVLTLLLVMLGKTRSVQGGSLCTWYARSRLTPFKAPQQITCEMCRYGCIKNETCQGYSWNNTHPPEGGFLPSVDTCGAVCSSFSPADAAAIVDSHNSYRGTVRPSAANMLALEWDCSLASVAQAYSASCNWEHNAARTTMVKSIGGTFSYVGENLYAATYNRRPPPAGQSASNAVAMWNAEYKFYNYSSNFCANRQICGHYTQLVWATTTRVGCGHTVCKSVTGMSLCYTGCDFVVCDYGEGGNYVGKKPYASGTPCSKCPSGNVCSNNVCTAVHFAPPSAGPSSVLPISSGTCFGVQFLQGIALLVFCVVLV